MNYWGLLLEQKCWGMKRKRVSRFLFSPWICLRGWMQGNKESSLIRPHNIKTANKLIWLWFLVKVSRLRYGVFCFDLWSYRRPSEVEENLEVGYGNPPSHNVVSCYHLLGRDIPLYDMCSPKEPSIWLAQVTDINKQKRGLYLAYCSNLIEKKKATTSTM